MRGRCNTFKPMFKLFQKKQAVITQKSEWINTLDKMIEILDDNSFSSQANWVKQIHGALTRDDISDFIKKLNSVEMWGGSGAVWEVGGFRSRDEEIEFGKQIISLVELMKNDQIDHGKAKSVSRYFKKEFDLK